jgi:hypothetical protein
MQVAGLVPWPSSGGFIRSHYLATDEPAGGGNMALRRRRGRNCPETGRWVWGRQHGRNPRVVGVGRERGIRPPPYVPCWRRHSDSSLSPFHHGRLLTFGWGHERFVAGMPFSRKRDAMAAPFGLCCLCIRVTTFRRVLTRDEAELTRTRKGVG